MFGCGSITFSLSGDQGSCWGDGGMAESWWKACGTREWGSEGTGEGEEFALEKFTFCPTGEAGCSF